jgi:hypothetical protein
VPLAKLHAQLASSAKVCIVGNCEAGPPDTVPAVHAASQLVMCESKHQGVGLYRRVGCGGLVVCSCQCCCYKFVKLASHCLGGACAGGAVASCDVASTFSWFVGLV